MTSAPTAHAAGRGTALLLLMACLGACDRTAQHGGSIARAATTAPAPVAAPTPPPAASAADAALAIAVAREASSRAAREQTLRVQQHLVEQERAREDAQRGDGSERCLAGQKMRRVANGWVQAGTC
jgi:hypothetical protein